MTIPIDTTQMCSHLQRKLFDAEGEYHRLWLALQEDAELTAVVRSRQLHIYRNRKKVLVLAGKAAPKIIREDPICEMLATPNAKAADGSQRPVETTELFRTSQSWDGVALPDYPQGRPELVAMKYVFPVGKRLGWHHHDVMNCGTKPAILYMFYLAQQGTPLSVTHPEIQIVLHPTCSNIGKTDK